MKNITESLIRLDRLEMKLKLLRSNIAMLKLGLKAPELNQNYIDHCLYVIDQTLEY